MKFRKRMNFQIKKEFLGKVRLNDERTSTPLDENTTQDVLAKLYDTVLGKGFIEPVTDKVAQPKDDAKTGQ